MSDLRTASHQVAALIHLSACMRWSIFYISIESIFQSWIMATITSSIHVEERSLYPIDCGSYPNSRASIIFLFTTSSNREAWLRYTGFLFLGNYSLHHRGWDQLFNRIFHSLSSYTLLPKSFILEANLFLMHTVCRVAIVVLQNFCPRFTLLLCQRFALVSPFVHSVILCVSLEDRTHLLLDDVRAGECRKVVWPCKPWRYYSLANPQKIPDKETSVRHSTQFYFHLDIECCSKK